MKYLGKKSLSSFMSGLLNISWYAVLIFSILFAIGGSYIMFSTPVENPEAAGLAKMNYWIFNEMKDDQDWQDFQKVPYALRFLFIPYFAALVVLLLKIIDKSRGLFRNFRDNIVFNQSNVTLMRRIAKLLIIFSIMTFDISSLLASLLLLLLCEIFKNGTALQEEADLTV